MWHEKIYKMLTISIWNWKIFMKVKVKSLLCLTLCDPMDCSLQRSSVHGIFQARVLEWVAISFSRGSSQPRDQTWVSRIVGRCFTIWVTRKIFIVYKKKKKHLLLAVGGDRIIPKAKVLENRNGGGLVAKSCQTLCDPVNCRLPGSSDHDFPGKNTRVSCHLLL